MWFWLTIWLLIIFLTHTPSLEAPCLLNLAPGSSVLSFASCQGLLNMRISILSKLLSGHEDLEIFKKLRYCHRVKNQCFTFLLLRKTINGNCSHSPFLTLQQMNCEELIKMLTFLLPCNWKDIYFNSLLKNCWKKSQNPQENPSLSSSFLRNGRVT